MDRKGALPIIFFIFFVALAVFAATLISGFFQLSFFQKRDISMIQYAGTIPEDWDRPDIVKASTAAFDGYQITTEADSSGCTYSDWYCAANTCQGVQKGTDMNGCPLYENNLCYAEKMPAGYDPYKNAYCTWTTATKDGKVYYASFGGTTSCGLQVTQPCGTTAKYCYTYTCQSPGYMTYNVPVTAKTCGGLTRDQISCGTGCFARFTIKKDGTLLYDSVDKLKTQDVKLIPIGVTTTATLKTLCRYESTGENYVPCIYQDGLQAGEYAPISYCEKLYGFLVSCDDVLVDDKVEKNMLQYGVGEDLFLDYKLLKIQFNYNSLYKDGDCRRVENAFQYIIPEEAFNFSVIVPEGEVMEGEDISIDIKINNRWQGVKGDLQVYFEVPTVLSNPSTETRSEIIDIPQGESVHSFTIPTSRVTDTLLVKPTLYVLVEGSKFQGVNGVCYGQSDSNVRDLNKCEYVQIGTVYDDPHLVQIRPDEMTVPVLITNDQCRTHFDCDEQCSSGGLCKDPDGKGKRCYCNAEPEKAGFLERVWAWLKSIFGVGK